jgi:hypothetical protein
MDHDQAAVGDAGPVDDAHVELWPGRRIRLERVRGGALVAQVVQAGDDGVVVDLLDGPDVRVTPETGDELRIVLGSPSGLLASTTWVTDMRDPRVHLSVPTSQTVKERRRHQRVPLATTVTWRSYMWDRDVWGSAGAVDVSLGGLRMSVEGGTPRPPQVGDVIDLRLPLGDSDDALVGEVETRALVVGAEPSGTGVTCRVAFSSLDDVATRRLIRLCGPG